MGWLKRFLNGGQVVVEPPSYDTPWDAIRAFVHDPQWQVEILDQNEGWSRIRYDGVIGELLDDPEDEWLHMRFRDPFTEQQNQDELAMYVGWTHHTLFRWDIDVERQEYYGDAFALFEPQHDAVECIRAAWRPRRHRGIPAFRSGALTGVFDGGRPASRRTWASEARADSEDHVGCCVNPVAAPAEGCRHLKPSGSSKAADAHQKIRNLIEHEGTACTVKIMRRAGILWTGHLRFLQV